MGRNPSLSQEKNSRTWSSTTRQVSQNSQIMLTAVNWLLPFVKKGHYWVNVLNKAQVKSALLQHPWGRDFGIPDSLNADGGAHPWNEVPNQPLPLQWKWFPPKLNIDFWIKILTFLLQMCRISLWPKTMKSRACTVNLLIQWCQNSSWSRGCCSYWRLSKRELLRRTPCKCRCR